MIIIIVMIPSKHAPHSIMSLPFRTRHLLLSIGKTLLVRKTPHTHTCKRQSHYRLKRLSCRVLSSISYSIHRLSVIESDAAKACSLRIQFQAPPSGQKGQVAGPWSSQCASGCWDAIGSIECFKVGKRGSGRRISEVALVSNGMSLLDLLITPRSFINNIDAVGATGTAMPGWLTLIRSNGEGRKQHMGSTLGDCESTCFTSLGSVLYYYKVKVWHVNGGAASTGLLARSGFSKSLCLLLLYLHQYWQTRSHSLPLQLVSSIAVAGHESSLLHYLYFVIIILIQVWAPTSFAFGSALYNNTDCSATFQCAAYELGRAQDCFMLEIPHLRTRPEKNELL